jgi:hypothetical protein
MWSKAMKSLLLAGIVSVAFGTACHADQYWVAGDRNTGKCNIVTSQPVTYGLPAYNDNPREYPTSFASGPYQTRDDAKLARSTINSCPPPDPDEDKKD